MSAPIETDVIVLGVVTCGEDAALQLLDAGLEVVGIEAALVGGECPYWACLPSKRFLRNADLIAEARRADGVAGQVEVRRDRSLVARQVRDEVTGGWDDAGAVARFGRRGRAVRPTRWSTGQGPRSARRSTHDRGRRRDLRGSAWRHLGDRLTAEHVSGRGPRRG